ncbi:1313_t:CDS:10, partial [Gigaspora margarita]
MLGNLDDAKCKFPNDFGERLDTVPNVGLATKLNLDQDKDENNLNGKLFCFFPLPIDTPFRVSINGHFAVTNNRRDLWFEGARDLISDSLANLKVKWNKYLFEEVIPQAWVKFIIKLQSHIKQKEAYYKFWPIADQTQFISLRFFEGLLENMIRKLTADDEIFCEKNGQILSISKGYFPDESCAENDIPDILSKIGFPIINATSEIIEVLKKSDKKNILRFYSPSIVSNFLQKREELQDKPMTLRLFYYLLNDENYEILEGLKMIPLANGTLKAISQYGTVTYICSDRFAGQDKDDPREIFKDQSEKFIAKDISSDLLNRLIYKVKNGWNIKIEMLTIPSIVDMVKYKIYPNENQPNSSDHEIVMENPEWINRLWKYLCDRFDETDLKSFEDIHLIPTKHNTLRKLKTNHIKYFLNSIESSQTQFDKIEQIYPILEKLGIIFLNSEFENNITLLKKRLSAYICDVGDINSVLSSLNTNEALNLDTNEAELFIKYLSYYLRISKPPTYDQKETIKRLPIFKEVGKNETASLKFKINFLLPKKDEMDYGQIIAPESFRFLDTTSEEARYLLEDIIKIQRLQQDEYWINYVIKYLESNYDKDIVVEKLFERLPGLVSLNSSLREKLSNIPIVPCVTLRMAQGKQNLGTIKRSKPINLYDPFEPKITQLFFDDEQVFPAEKFLKLYSHLLKVLGMKTSLSPVDIIERIKTYIKHQKIGKNNDDLYDKSRNLFKYIDVNWNSLEDKNAEFFSFIKSSKWIPTINQFGDKSFSSSNECRDKKDEHLVSLKLSILDYRIKSQFRKHLEWNKYPPVNIVLEQMKLCSTLPKENNQQQKICEAIYKYIDETISHDDERSKQVVKEIKDGLKNEEWIFCKSKFYAAKNVVFILPTNLLNKLPIIQLPDDYRNNFKEVFKHMGVRETVDVNDFIKIIREIAHEANNKALNDENLSKTIAILDQIGKEFNKSNKKKTDYLKNLLIPSTDAILFSFEEIKYDNMAGLNNDEKENYKLSHPKISIALAKDLGIQMLSEAFIKGSDIDFEIYEQFEPLTTRINKIISNCSLDSLFREFLQNADDAGAHRYSIYIDERTWCNETDQSTLLSKEMCNWQGPAIWIYNDAVFKEEDFSSLIKLGVGGKSEDDRKIGRFGLGITTSYYLTDVLSFVSEENIAFLDPHARFLPMQGNPPKQSRGIKLNFLDKKILSRFENQCKPYTDIENCDFKKGFKGTLFRLPLRSTELSKQSLISQNSIGHEKILSYLRNLKDKDNNKRLIWETKIQNLKDIRNIRSKIKFEPQVFQLDIKINDAQHNNETNINSQSCLKAHGGIAAILARSNNESLKNSLDLTNPPILDGKEYAYVLCNDNCTKLNVHINGNFALSKDRMIILQQNNTYGKWNRYILFKVLPTLHVKLLNEISEKITKHFKNSNIKSANFGSYITKNFWPFGKVKQGHLYYDYALNVLQNLGESKVFWTEAEGGKFVSLNDAYFSEENDPIIADILAKHDFSTVKVDKAMFNQFKEGKTPIKYNPISPKFVYESLHANNNILKSASQGNILILLKFVLQDKKLYSQLIGLRLVPLKDSSFGEFGPQTYYMAKKKYQDLFPKSSASRFICDLDDELNRIFESDEFSSITHIKKLDAEGILDLLAEELPKKQEIWLNTSSQDIPNRKWLDKILEKMEWGLGLDIEKLSEYPLFPVISPTEQPKIVRIDPSNPLLVYPDDLDVILMNALGKIGICFTDIKFNKKNVQSVFWTKGVINWDYTNVFESIKRKQVSQNISMEELFFKNASLNEDELNKLRECIKIFINSQRGTQGRKDNNVIKVIQELPIWPTHSSSQCEYISAKKGKLPPRSLPCNLSDKDLLNVQDEYFRILTLLGAKSYNEYDYVKQYYTPDSKREPTEEDVEFLEKILLLKNQEILNYLKNFDSIPNKKLKKFMKADDLYDVKVDFFSQIFDENKFLPLKLQNNPDCLYVLSNIGFKREINKNTFIECAREIEYIIDNNIDKEIRPIAIDLAKYFCHNFKSLKFEKDDMNQLYEIKFVPSNEKLSNPYNETAVNTLGYESISSLYSINYQKICWTKAKFFASDVTNFGRSPKIKMVIEHWKYLIDGKIFQRPGWEVNTVYEIMEEIYKFVSEFLEKEEGRTTKLDLEKLHFLNGDDPFNTDCWVPGNKLAFAIQNDIGDNLFKVKPRLKPFKKLLIAAGAKNTNNDIKINKIPTNHSQQKDELIKYLTDHLNEEKLDPQQHHDVIFEIRNLKIGANRCVLLRVANYFDWEFSVNPTTITISNARPNTYKVLLRWLYGMPYSEAVEEIFGKEFSGQDYLEFLLDFLKESYKYQPLNYIIQNEIMDENRRLINENNVKKIRDLSDECNANHLKEYCEGYIEKNQSIVDAIDATQTKQNHFIEFTD